MSEEVETEEDLFKKLKSLPPETTTGSRFKFNPNPIRHESSLHGVISLRVINAAKIVCKRSEDGSCDHHEVAAVLVEAGIDMSPKRILAMLTNLSSTNGYKRTASAIFIRVPKIMGEVPPAGNASVLPDEDAIPDNDDADADDAEVKDVVDEDSLFE